MNAPDDLELIEIERMLARQPVETMHRLAHRFSPAALRDRSLAERDAAYRGTDTAAKAELRARAEALMAENTAPLPDEGEDDTRLIEAERRFRISEHRRHALYDEFKSVFEDDDDIWATEKALIDVVDQIAPRTLAGAVAKLRVILWNKDLELDRDPSLRQVMEFLEATVDAGGRP